MWRFGEGAAELQQTGQYFGNTVKLNNKAPQATIIKNITKLDNSIPLQTSTRISLGFCWGGNH